ncbi:hypothetical protein [Clostridium psychrophilum]|uniref:hypothetical protein n=1 Tax=Clostridium psychrophilum TaxID=132926 RepID=UPI001C0C1094|nr:hypothetical protein [Clostridium psychrophilum]MBU3180494.1 hypothetical protein [Clostridium psychrophilum]
MILLRIQFFVCLLLARPNTPSNGRYAEHITVAEDLVVKIQANIRFDKTVSVPLAGTSCIWGLVI